MIGAGLVLALALVACGRVSTTNNGPTLAAVYGGRIALSDVSGLLGDTRNWAQGAPTFDVRPLNSATREDADRLGVTLRFSHIGTREELRLHYQVWSSTAIATAIVDLNKTVLGTSLTGPRAGDQVLYFNQNLQAGAAPYASEALVRVGQVVLGIVLSRVQSFASTGELGKVAVKAATRLKDSLAGKIHASATPSPDPLLLAPAGPDVTLLGSDRLPVNVVAQMLFVANPGDLALMFNQLGASDFVYGDYALNSDTRMEVLTSGFTFSDSSGAKKWIESYYGASNLTSGVYFNYENDTGQYVAAFGAGNRGILMVCKSSAPGEEAARACESPMSRVITGWRLALAG